MKSWTTYLFAALLLIPSSGCVQFAALVDLDSNGSGRVFLRYLISEQLDNQKLIFSNNSTSGESIRSADDAAHQSVAATPQVSDQSFLEQVEKQSRSMADRLGGEVTFVETKRITDKPGWRGIQVEYRFKDINQVEIPFGEAAFPKKKEDKSPASSFLSVRDRGPIYFRYQPGVVNELVAYHKSRVKPAKLSDPFEAAGLETTQAPVAKLNISSAVSHAIGKAFLQGFRITTMVKVDGDIVKTNALSRPKPNSAVLLDLDLTPFTQDSRYDRAMLEAWSLEKMIQEKVPGIHAKPHEEETLIRWKN